jgi:hypothetical protein
MIMQKTNSLGMLCNAQHMKMITASLEVRVTEHRADHNSAVCTLCSCKDLKMVCLQQSAVMSGLSSA